MNPTIQHREPLFISWDPAMSALVSTPVNSTSRLDLSVEMRRHKCRHCQVPDTMKVLDAGWTRPDVLTIDDQGLMHPLTR